MFVSQSESVFFSHSIGCRWRSGELIILVILSFVSLGPFTISAKFGHDQTMLSGGKCFSVALLNKLEFFQF